MPYVVEEGETKEGTKDYYYDENGNKVWFEEPTQRVLKVKVTKDNDETLENVKKERDHYEKMLSDLAEAEFEKAKQELKQNTPFELHSTIESFENPEDLEKFAEIYNVLRTDKPSKTVSSGIVSLLPKNRSPSLGYKEFDSVEDMIATVYRQSRQGNPEARQYINRLWDKAKSKSVGNRRMVIDKPKVKDVNERYVRIFGVLVPESDAKLWGSGQISDEEMIKRIQEGYY